MSEEKKKMTLQEEANLVVEDRMEINKLEEAFEKKIKPLKIKAEKIVNEFKPRIEELKLKKIKTEDRLMDSMKTIGFKSIKTDEGVNIAVTEKPFLEISDQNVLVKFLEEEGQKDLLKVSIVKSLFNGYVETMAKKKKKIPGTKISVTRYMSIRNLKGAKK